MHPYPLEKLSREPGAILLLQYRVYPYLLLEILCYSRSACATDADQGIAEAPRLYNLLHLLTHSYNFHAYDGYQSINEI